MSDNFPFIHSDISIKKINLTYVIALIFPILFGFYKNGIYLYQKNLISFYKIIYPVLFPIIGFLICMLSEFLFCKLKNKKHSYISLYPIQGMIVGCLVYPNVNIFIYIIVLFIISFLLLFLNIGNKVALMGTLILLIFSLFGINTLNNYENVNPIINSTGLMFVGFTQGGISSTSVLFLLISFIYLCVQLIYKKEAGFYYILTLFILCFICFIMNHHLYNSYLPLFSYNVFFSGVFILTDIKSCPNNETAKKIYGILCATIIFCLTYFFKFSLSSLLVISIFSFLSPFLDKLVKKIKHI